MNPNGTHPEKQSDLSWDEKEPTKNEQSMTCGRTDVEPWTTHERHQYVWEGLRNQPFEGTVLSMPFLFRENGKNGSRTKTNGHAFVSFKSKFKKVPTTSSLREKVSFCKILCLFLYVWLQTTSIPKIILWFEISIKEALQSNKLIPKQILYNSI